MMWSPIAAAIRNCVGFTRRRVATAPAEPPKLTMEQVAVLLRPRSPVVRRAVALGCPAAALPTTMLLPGAPAPLPVPPPVPPPTPLPFGIGAGELLPSAFGAPPAFPSTPVYDTIAQAPAGVPEPGALAILAVALAMFAAVLTWRRA